MNKSGVTLSLMVWDSIPTSCDDSSFGRLRRIVSSSPGAKKHPRNVRAQPEQVTKVSKSHLDTVTLTSRGMNHAA